MNVTKITLILTFVKGTENDTFNGSKGIVKESDKGVDFKATQWLRMF